MLKILISLVLILCIAAWRINDIKGIIGTPTTDMTNEKLIELSKTNPKAFDAFIQSKINNTQPADITIAPTSAVQKTITPEEFMKAGKTDQKSVKDFLESNVQGQEQHNEADKLMNFLAHGKYE